MTPVETKRKAFIIRTILFSARQKIVNTREKGKKGRDRRQDKRQGKAFRNRHGKAFRNEKACIASMLFFKRQDNKRSNKAEDVENVFRV